MSEIAPTAPAAVDSMRSTATSGTGVSAKLRCGSPTTGRALVTGLQAFYDSAREVREW